MQLNQTDRAKAELLQEASESYAASARSERFRGRVSLIGSAILGFALEAGGAYFLSKTNIDDGAFACTLGAGAIACGIPIGVREYMQAAVDQHRADRIAAQAEKLAATLSDAAQLTLGA
jgi:hypothetical protein